MPRYLALYAALYAAFGVASPFLPAFVHERGLDAERLGLVLGAGTAVRLLTAPAAGRLGDRLRALRPVLVVFIAAAAVVTLGYLPAHGFAAFLALSLAQAAALAPITILADALSARQAFEYGRVRGAGSAAFIAGTLVSGQVVAALGLGAIVWMQAALLAAAALAAARVHEIAHPRGAAAPARTLEAIRVLVRLQTFRSLIIVAALVLGSHALHDSFAVIRWSSAGIGPAAASLLWSESVAAEVLVFFVVGPPLLRRATPAAALAIAAVAGIVRWSVAASTTHIAALALVQPLHGITFALLHLACMRVIARVVPPGLEGTAQAIYGTVAVGGTTALMTFASGALYARVGGAAFWVMAALCALALPVALRLKERNEVPPGRAAGG